MLSTICRYLIAVLGVHGGRGSCGDVQVLGGVLHECGLQRGAAGSAYEGVRPCPAPLGAVELGL